MASRLIVCLFLLFAVFSPFHSARSQAVAEPFTIQGVDVDVTAGNANAAKAQALADGQRQAFQRLLDRLTNPKDRGRVPKADGADYVSDYAIETERASSVRYIATLTVRFNGTAVRHLLKGAGIAMIEPITHPVVVVPVFRSGGQTLIWEDGNPWRSAWVSQGKGGIVAVVVPSGSDGAVPTADQIIANDEGALSALGGRYHTGDVLVSTADLSGDGHKLEVSTAPVRGSSYTVPTVSVAAKSGETADQMLARAVREIMPSLEAQAQQLAASAGSEAKDAISAIVPVGGLADWLWVRDRLSRGGQVKSWELVSLTRTEAAVVLRLSGETDKAQAALARAGLDLQFGDGFWVLKAATAKR